MDLSIIIVNYRSRDKLANCLASLAAADLGDLRYEVIVVNNDQRDDLSELNSHGLDLEIIPSRRNLGMGGGNNLGLSRAQGEYTLILNPDTIIKGRAIPELRSYLEAHPNIGLIAPKLLYPDGSLQYSCSRFPGFFIPILRRTFLGDYFKRSRDHFQMLDFDHQEIRSVDWLMGSCLMFRREIRQPDGSLFYPRFDERYFMYFEDIDLARACRARSLDVVYYPLAVVVHDHQRDSAKHPWYLALFRDKITWVHISSWLKYFLKWGLRNN